MRELLLGVRGGSSTLRVRLPVALASVGLLLCAVVALLEKKAHPISGAYATLFGAVFGIAVPVYCYCVVAQLHSRENVRARLGWTRFGINRRRYAFGELLLAVAWAAGFSALAGVVAVILSGAPSSAGLARDIVSATWIGMLGAMTYSALFAAAGTWWRGHGALVALAADWLLGSGTAFASFPWPRAHLRNLLGGEPIMNLSQAASSGLLALLILVFLLILLGRTPP